MIQGFVFQFCDHAQEEFDKFGYQVSEGKYNNSRILPYFGNLLESIVQIWQFQILFPQNQVTLPLFFVENPLYELHWIRFCQQVAKIRPKRNTNMMSIFPFCTVIIF
jgi:hypothetical protein